MVKFNILRKQVQIEQVLAISPFHHFTISLFLFKHSTI